MSRLLKTVLPLALVAVLSMKVDAEDWPGFRGPKRDNVSSDKNIPTDWSLDKNLVWKIALPGPGSSSPIVSGDRVYVTCYSGYGVDRNNPGSLNELKRHLVCVDRKTGKQIWSKSVDSDAPEDRFSGYITEHGYASSTPVTDGENVFAFFGKTGVLAFDKDGKQLWKTSVGTDSSNRRWGSGSSLLLYKNTIIVNASEESRSIRALDKTNGKEVWKTEAGLLELAYTTPGLAKVGDHDELVIPVPGEVWSLNPNTGKLKWYCLTNLTGNISPTPVFKDDTAFIYGGFRGAGSMSIRLGGKGDVTKTHVGWTSRNSSYVATPVFDGSFLYWVDDRGVARCSDAANGEMKYQQRLGQGGGGGRPFYSSPVLCNGKIYAVSRWEGTFVLKVGEEFKQVATNKFAGDDSDFNASPAISDGQIFIRSNKNLYCVQTQ